jgi:hypothetical protein
MLVVGGLAVVLALCVGSIRSLILLDRAGRARLNEGSSLGRLARQFRQDAHAAVSGQSARANDKQPRLELTLPSSRTVEYRWEGARILRTERRADKSEMHEVYRMPNYRGPSFTVREDGDRTWVTIALERTSGPMNARSAREFRIEARLGKDQQWSMRGGKTP